MSDKDTAPGDPPPTEGGSPDPSTGGDGTAPGGPKKENPLTNIMVNVLIPVVALTMLSKDAGKPWHFGPLIGMLVAVAFPLCYGIYDLIVRRKVNFFSILGLVSVLLTGGLTLFLWEEGDKVADNAAVLFGIKEACIPVMFGITILLSHWTDSPLVRVFLYTPELFDIPRIEKTVKANDNMDGYLKLIFQTTLIMSLSFFISAVANYFLAQHFLQGADTRELYNAGVGKLTGWGFLVIGLPCLVLWMGALFRLIKGIKSMTGLDTDSIFVPR
ncbi:MAG: VC0807 family protein [Verrucomicrobiales bacterium]